MFKLSVVFQFSAYRDTDDTTKGMETKMAETKCTTRENKIKS